MSLVTLTTAADIYTSYDIVMEEARNGVYNGHSFFIGELASKLDAAFQGGTLSALSVDITGVAGTLSFPDITHDNSLALISSKIKDYWVAAVGLGVPQSCYAVVSVTNDAAKIEQMIYDGLVALGGATTPEPNPFEGFVDVIFTAVKSIVWTVSEADARPCSTNYTVTIS